MSDTICLHARTINATNAGGHVWVYLNWALGLRAAGYNVIWLERVSPKASIEATREEKAQLKNILKRYGLDDCLAICSRTEDPLPKAVAEGTLDIEAASDAILLLNLSYGISQQIVNRFPRSALVDIDPGRCQIWLAEGQITIAKHDTYFTTGETVGRSDATFPDAGLKWDYTPPCVASDWWTPQTAEPDASFTTLTHWYEGWMKYAGESYVDSKKAGFEPFFDLPKHTSVSLELALDLDDSDDERTMLQQKGWRVRHSKEVSSTPWDYEQYICESRGEFSCARPSCVRLQNAWVSDRSLCYLASGKPVIVQHTGPSRFLPDAAGMFRFRDFKEAVHCLEAVNADYEHQCQLARALAEEHFDAKKVVKRVLERALI